MCPVASPQIFEWGPGPSPWPPTYPQNYKHILVHRFPGHKFGPLFPEKGPFSVSNISDSRSQGGKIGNYWGAAPTLFQTGGTGPCLASGGDATVCALEPEASPPDGQYGQCPYQYS